MPDGFVDWWFAPWSYASAATHASADADLVGRRDAYRDWCASMEVPGEFPLQFDPGWHCAVSTDGAELQHTAALFMGLIAARSADQAALSSLSLADRRWCLSIAATQPLQAFAVAHPDSDDTLAGCGLAELAIRLEQGFPGLWPRLRLTLPGELRTAVGLRADNRWPDADHVGRAARRSQRCWRLCRQRSEESA
ncbi:hypothetical protein [Actimicrobium sp. GrIS 1.19]|uniref:hypothetical protein n=1 Tax=Actimicrobium sp. GrIS 1.19 TaxID=3071708 RepID=UPI002E142F9C